MFHKFFAPHSGSLAAPGGGGGGGFLLAALPFDRLDTGVADDGLPRAANCEMHRVEVGTMNFEVRGGERDEKEEQNLERVVPGWGW